MSRWSIPLDRIVAEQKSTLTQVVRDTTVMVFQSVVSNSPVDKGRFRANMNVSYGVPDQTVTYSTDKDRADAEIKKVMTLPVGGVVFITNALPYAAVLEYGGYPNPPKKGSRVRNKGAKGGRGDPKWSYVIKSEGGYSRQAPHGMFRLAAVQFNDFVMGSVKK